MRKFQIKDSDLMKVALQQEIMRSEESRYDHRLHGVLLVCSGFSCNEVANLLGHGPRTIQYWVKRFEQSGFSGLEEVFRPGRPSLLEEKTRSAVSIDLRHPPKELGYGQNLWDGKTLSHHLAQKYGIRLGVRQCQRLFHEFGFRRRKPRPLIAKADRQAQVKYKKTPSLGQKN
jgi:transposase